MTIINNKTRNKYVRKIIRYHQICIEGLCQPKKKRHFSSVDFIPGPSSSRCWGSRTLADHSCAFCLARGYSPTALNPSTATEQMQHTHCTVLCGNCARVTQPVPSIVWSPYSGIWECRRSEAMGADNHVVRSSAAVVQLLETKAVSRVGRHPSKIVRTNFASPITLPLHILVYNLYIDRTFNWNWKIYLIQQKNSVKVGWKTNHAGICQKTSKVPTRPSQKYLWVLKVVQM